MTSNPHRRPTPPISTPKRRRMNTKTLRGLAVVSLAAFTIVRPALPQSASVADSAPLGPGDAIRTTFWREPQMSGEYRVDETGTVVLPLLEPATSGGSSRPG